MLPAFSKKNKKKNIIPGNQGLLVLGGYIKNRKLAVVNQGPRQSDDQMSGKRVSGMRHLKTALVALSDRQSTNTIMVISRD